MLKKITNFLLPVISLFFCFTEKVFAEGEGYSLLAPIPTVTGSTQPDLVTYMKGLFTLFVGLSIVFAVFVIIYGGVKYTLAIVPGAKSDAKKRMTDAILGLFIVLISSILLNTINPGLLRVGLKLEPVKFDAIIDTGTLPDGSFTSKTPHYCKNVGILNTRMCYTTKEECDAQPGFIPFADCELSNEATTEPLETGDEDANRKLLTDTGHITINAGSETTELAGVRQGTLNEVVRMQAECNCNIVVTAGSETTGGHNCSNPDGYNHCNGYKVDLRVAGLESDGGGTALSNFIMDNPEKFTKIGPREGDGAMQYQASSGAIYAYESTPPHWDVLVK